MQKTEAQSYWQFVADCDTRCVAPMLHRSNPLPITQYHQLLTHGLYTQTIQRIDAQNSNANSSLDNEMKRRILVQKAATVSICK